MTQLHGARIRANAESAGPDPVGLDHVGLYAHDMGAAAALYERLGFQLTPLSQHSGTHAVTREVVKAGIANRCAMLGHGYIELVAVVDPALDLRGIPDGLARYAGMHIIAFDTAQPEQRIAALREAGFAAEPGVLQRYIGTPQGPKLARFSQVRTSRDAMPEGLILTLRHETPELLWQERYLSHPTAPARWRRPSSRWRIWTRRRRAMSAIWAWPAHGARARPGSDCIRDGWG